MTENKPIATEYADLEVRILARQDKGYPVEITYSGEQEFPRAFLDPKILPWRRRTSGEEEGEDLFLHLFRAEELRQAWIEARGQNPRRRLRLRIDEAAPELHTLPWETLRNPDPAGPEVLAADHATPFSRYLAGRWRPGQPILERPIQMLMVIAAPRDLEDYGLAALDTEAERRALEAALAEVDESEIELTVLEPPVTLAALDAALRRGPHILHVVAHGMSPPDEPAALFLSDSDGLVAPVTEEEFAAMLGRQGEALRLVYLSSCQSATRSPADTFRGFAPTLVAAGIPAVLAMQEHIAIDTARAFASTFYRRLLTHGLVDLATNEARSSILSSDLPGAAIPALYLRLRSGRLFERRGRVVGKEGESFWHILLENIADGECTPFLGPRVTTGLLPAPDDLARLLACEHGYPLAGGDRLPRVAQYVGTLDNLRLRKDVIRHLITGFQSRAGQRPDDLDRRNRRAGLAATLTASGWPKGSADGGELEIHQQLAALDLPLYLTTSFDNFMTLALAARQRNVRRELLPWHQPPDWLSANPYRDFDPPASPEDPVVLHLFGHDEDLLSLVLTEDDHLDYLARIARDHEHLLPTSVGEALARNTLLFLGYRLEDLDLKILLRGLLTTLDLERWGRYHVAVQIEEATGGGAEQEEVLRYFQKYFGSSRIDVYWGNTQQFVADLHGRFQEFRDA